MSATSQTNDPDDPESKTVWAELCAQLNAAVEAGQFDPLCVEEDSKEMRDAPRTAVFLYADYAGSMALTRTRKFQSNVDPRQALIAACCMPDADLARFLEVASTSSSRQSAINLINAYSKSGDPKRMPLLYSHLTSDMDVLFQAGGAFVKIETPAESAAESLATELLQPLSAATMSKSNASLVGITATFAHGQHADETYSSMLVTPVPKGAVPNTRYVSTYSELEPPIRVLFYRCTHSSVLSNNACSYASLCVGKALLAYKAQAHDGESDTCQRFVFCHISSSRHDPFRFADVFTKKCGSMSCLTSWLDQNSHHFDALRSMYGFSVNKHLNHCLAPAAPNEYWFSLLLWDIRLYRLFASLIDRVLYAQGFTCYLEHVI